MKPTEIKGIVWDMMMAGELYISDTSSAVRLHLKDSSTAAFNYVLLIHNLSKQSFLHSFQYYQAHPDKQSELIDTLIAYNDKQQKIFEKQNKRKDTTNKSKPKSDTASIDSSKNKKLTIDSQRTPIQKLPAIEPPAKRLPQK